MCRSPSQTQDEFEEFCNDLNLLLSNVNDVNATLSVITGDFNAKSSRWWSLDKDNAEGREINSLTSASGYGQLINKSTHVTKESSSCIDLIFATSSNLIRETGVALSISEKCHHNLIYGIIDFKVPLPQPYLREVWDYKNANVNHTKSAVSSIDWEFLFHGANVNKKVDILNECLKNIFHDLIPNRIIKCNYRDLPWVTDVIKSKLKKRSYLTKTYYKYGERKSDFEKVIVKVNECSEMVSAAKDKYINKMCEKLNDPITALKTYWKIINRFLSNKKIPAIPPLLVYGEIISNFSQKASIFNKFFASQCTPLQNSSSLTTFYLRTDETLSTLNISYNIFAIIKNVNPNKSHGWDNISIRMIKLCGKSIVYPLKFIFEVSLQDGELPDYWKKATVVPVHKKESKNLVKNYRPISLLPIFGKIFDIQGLI